MNSKEKLAKKLGITVEELENRIQKNKEAEEDLIDSTAKKKNKSAEIMNQFQTLAIRLNRDQITMNPILFRYHIFWLTKITII